MIACPRCGRDLEETRTGLSCRSCPYRAEREDGMIVFERDIRSGEDVDALFAHEGNHPWFTHRMNVIRKAFAAHVGKDEEILEVGAGTGYTARELLASGYRNLSISEIHRNGLLYAKQYGLERLYQFDLRSPPFEEHFDAVALFDVLEHIREDDLVLRSIHRMLRPGGRILLTVPAHRWLWSRIDELSGHHRRYNRKGLMALLCSAGFEVVECRYFFIALVPGLLIRSLLSRRATQANVASACGMQVSKLGETILKLACGPGDALLRPLRNLIGGSLLAVARRT